MHSPLTLNSVASTRLHRLAPAAMQLVAALGFGVFVAQAPAQALPSGEIKIARPLASAADFKTPAPAAKRFVSRLEASTAMASHQSIPVKGVALPPALAQVQPPSMDRLVWDTADDGSIWVRGSNYKACFNAGGMTYIPFTGSDAPHNAPVHFALVDAKFGGVSMPFVPPVGAVREGDRISIDRGDVIEVYDVRPESVEQSFVFETMPRAGDIELRVATTTDMSRNAGANDLSFVGERGGVRYSHAVVIDANGRQSAAPTSFKQGAIAIIVPSQFAAEATMPLVVDPIISAFSAEVSSSEAVVSDVAYDASTQSYFVTWEMNFSEIDGDIYCDTYDQNGQSKDTFTSINISSENWRNPACANNNIADSFLVAAEVGLAPDRVIKGRTRLAASGGAGSPFTISGSEGGDKRNPTAGGDPHTLGPTFYCVAWQRDLSGTDTDIHARLVDSAGAPAGNNVIFLSNSSATLDGLPAISKSNGLPPAATQAWTVVWERNYLVGDTDILGAQLAWDGDVIHSLIDIDSTDTVVRNPTVSTVLDSTGIGVRPYMVTYDVLTANFNRDIHASVFHGDDVFTSVNLSEMQQVRRAQDQYSPAVDSDGERFIVAHVEMYDTDPNDYDVLVSSFCIVGDELRASENRRVMAGNLNFEHRPCITSAHAAGGGEPIMLLSWQYDSTLGNGNIGGGFYESRFTCGCAADIAATFGVVNVSDLLMVVHFWGPTVANAPADINGDLFVNVADLLAVIASWGQCP